MFFLEKTSPSPTLPFRMKTGWRVHDSHYSRPSLAYVSKKFSLAFENFGCRCASRQNLFFEFCGLALTGKLAPVEIATFSCFNQNFSANARQSPLSSSSNGDTWKNCQHSELNDNTEANP
jgi:hypothetical protein